MAYDATSRRISKTVTGTGVMDDTTNFFLSGNSLIETRNGSDQLLEQYVHGVGYVDELVAIGADTLPGLLSYCNIWYSVQQDASYNVMGLTDRFGALTERYEYDAHGKQQVFYIRGSNDPAGLTPQTYSQTTNDAGTLLNEFGYQGLWSDSETGLIYNRARYMDGDLGFMSRDPDGYIDGANDRIDRAANPANRVDPTGTYDRNGHMYTTYLVALAAGIDGQKAFALAYYSQIPDEVFDFDATSQGISAIRKYIQAGVLYDPDVSWERDIFNLIHSLHGGNHYAIMLRRSCLSRLVRDPASGLDLWEKGVVIHALADSYDHTEGSGENEKSFEFPLGHATTSPWPDAISTSPDKYIEYIHRLYKSLGGETNPLHRPDVIDALAQQAVIFGQQHTSISDENEWFYDATDRFFGEGNIDMAPYSPGNWRFNSDFPTPTHEQMSRLMTKIAKQCKCSKVSP